MLHLHTDHEGNIKLTCRLLAEASKSFCGRMDIHKTQKGVMRVFFQTPDAPRQVLPSPEMDKTFRTNESFWGLRCFTHWQNHFLKICFLLTCHDLCFHILSKNICCYSLMWNPLGGIMLVHDKCALPVGWVPEAFVRASVRVLSKCWPGRGPHPSRNQWCPV